MKMGFKKTFLIISLCVIVINVLIFTGFSTGKEVKVNNNKGQYQQLMLKLNNGRIVLTADIDNVRQTYTNFKLKIGDNEKSFNWKSIGNINFGPTIRLIDLGDSKDSGVAIFLIKSLGTGVFIQNVHVIKLDDFKEIPVENPINIIQNHVKTQSTNDSIIINLDGNKIILDKNYLNKLGIINPTQKLIYEYHMVYGALNNNLFAEVGISNENLTYIGNIHIDYTYKAEMLVMSKINFEKFK